jgi:hypothetical protein
MMGNNKNPFFNQSGYADPTAYHGLKPIIQEEQELDKKVHNLINVLKFIVEWAGFEFIGRIQIKDKKSGKEFR